MPAGRILKYCVALSVLFHLAIGVLASMIPVTPRPAEDVMVVDLADLPRSTDFLPPKPGVIEGKRPEPARRARREMPPEVPSGVLRGPVPDLPVDPALSPEKEFPEQRPQREPPPRPKEPAARTARAAERAQEAKPASRAKGAEDAAKGGAGKPRHAPLPSLGEMVLAFKDSGAGRGQDDSRGTAAGTEAKARGKGDIVEEGGMRSELAALSGREIQYISYLASVKRKIDLVWGYPYDAQVAGIQGRVVIDFAIGSQGQVETLSVVAGSGHNVLDEAAKRAIRIAAPYNPVPTEYKEKYRTDVYQIRASFTYAIQSVSFP